MRYVDSALDRDGDRLAGWLSEELATAAALTLRTGFFTARALAVVQDALEGLLGLGGELLAVVGGDLLQCDVAALRVLLNLRGRYPEQTAIFVVTEPAFQNAKTYHLQHRDGRSSAWVGSANLTIGGFATNLEAAMVLDSKDDDPAVIDQVRAATVATAGQPAAVALDQAVLHQLEQRVRDARLGPPGTRPARPSPLIVDHYHWLLDRLDRATTNPAPAGGGVLEVLPTGFHELDTALAGGFRPGTVSVVASRPGAGRSTLVLNVLTQAAIVHRAAAALYSFEAPDDELVLRVVSATTRIRHLDLRHGRLDYTHWTTIADTLSRFADAPLYLDSHQPPHLDALCSTITAAVARDGIDLVAVDSPSHVLAGPRTDPHDSHVAEVLRRLKHLAMQLRIHIIATAELERPPQPSGPYRAHREQPPPRVDDLRDRDAVMETADVVVLLHRPDTDERDHPRSGEADLTVVKNRYAVPATVTIAHQLHYARFTTIGAPASPASPSTDTAPPPTDPTPSPTTQDEAGPPADGTSGDKEWLVAADDIEIMVRSVGAGEPPGDLPRPSRPRRRRMGRSHQATGRRSSGCDLSPSAWRRPRPAVEADRRRPGQHQVRRHPPRPPAQRSQNQPTLRSGRQLGRGMDRRPVRRPRTAERRRDGADRPSQPRPVACHQHPTPRDGRQRRPHRLAPRTV